MNSLITLREGLKRIYASYSLYINKALQFILGLLIFWGISKSIGYWSLLSSGLFVLGGALVCTFLPVNFTLFIAAVMILGNLYKLSLAALVMAALAVIILFIVYLRFSPKFGFVVLLVPLCCSLKIPCVIPMALGLACTPVAAVPAGIGAFMYYMVNAISGAEYVVEGEKELMAELMFYGRLIFTNKEMWLTIIVFAVIIIAVFLIRRCSFNYNWAVAILAGFLLNIILSLVVGKKLDVSVGFGSLLFGGLVAVVVAVILHWLFFTVRYKGAQKVQFEDDEYYYYVKAVPKVTSNSADNRSQESSVGYGKASKRTDKRSAADESDYYGEEYDDSGEYGDEEFSADYGDEEFSENN